MISLSSLLGGGVKSVQAGVVAAAGTVTITAVTVGKSFVLSVSKGSAGYVAARGNIALMPASGTPVGGNGSAALTSGTAPNYTGPITGGTTDLTTGQYSARLTGSTTLYCDGPCEWQVVENY